MIVVRVEFLTGRYVATAFNDRGRGEWPPHPARLFSALVAAWAEADTPSGSEQAALEWLEQQPPPAIAAGDAVQRTVMPVYVPVNDLTVVSDKAHRDAESLADDVQAAEGDRARRAAVKKAEKKQSSLVASMNDPKWSKDRAKHAVGLLPESRARQARTFPTMAPDSSVVEFQWDVDAPAEVLSALADLGRRVVALGHSSSLVTCRVTETPAGTPTWVPVEAGADILRVPRPGQLQQLEQLHAQAKAALPRVMPCAFQSYDRPRGEGEPDFARSVFSRHWIVLRRVGGPRLPAQRVVDIASAVRGALLAHAPAQDVEILSGHGPGGAPSQADHMAIVPLPFVGSEHADGSVLGVALCLPEAADEQQRGVVAASVARWEHGCRLEDESQPVLDVTLGRAGVLNLERLEWPASQASLREATWCRPSRLWASATPVALDRHPGDLLSRRPEVAAKAADEAAESVGAACRRIGLSQPAEVVVTPAPGLTGSVKVRAYPRFPSEPGRARRALVHCWLRFEQPVRGPLLLGAGRYRGLGLMRPLDDRREPRR